ncbi:MAG: ornithine carbamoyltransferase [Phycisphaeraceae bacterium]|nr:ornithine carbamoyltransferase [Phycisphaeraceae bacterium]
MANHFIDICDHEADWLSHVLDVGGELLEKRKAATPCTGVLAGKTLAMLFEKPSLRTRVSFEQAMYELGGHASVLSAEEVGLGQRESAADVARVLGGMVHGVMARVFEHQKLIDMAEVSAVPVINALSDESHPCQALADVMTLQQEFGPDLADRHVVFVGDGNNVARSLARLCAKLSIHFTLCSPQSHQIDSEEWESIQNGAGARIAQTTDPHETVRSADAIYTDTFVSMGQEAEKQQRLKAFEKYQVNEALVAAAPDHAIVLHCLPAYRGVEITDGVMDGPQSRVFQQAHNRLHAQKGLLAVLMGNL